MQERGPYMLWLPSWYPNPSDPFAGDFIQRHARAQATRQRIVVLFVWTGEREGSGSATMPQVSMEGMPEERLHRLNPSRWPGWAGRLLNNVRWLGATLREISKVRRQYGDPTGVHVHVAMRAGLIARWLKWRYGLRYIVTEHWTAYNDQLPDYASSRPPGFHQLSHMVFRGAAHVLPVSRQLGESIQRRYGPVACTVVPNVVDEKLFAPGVRQKPSHEFVFVHASVMTWQKNPEGILRAFASIATRHPQARLRMLGPAPDTVVAMAQSLGLPEGRIHFTGNLPHEEVASQFAEADALVLFSRYENAPCVIGEAHMAGIPVIATRVGGIPEMLAPYDYLIPPGDERALETAMEQCLQVPAPDPSEIRNAALHRYGIAQVSGLVEQVYRREFGSG